MQKQRDAITAPLLGAHPRAEKTNHDTPPSLTQFGKPRNFKEAEARLSRIACRQGQSFLAIRSLLYLWLHLRYVVIYFVRIPKQNAFMHHVCASEKSHF